MELYFVEDHSEHLSVTTNLCDWLIRQLAIAGCPQKRLIETSKDAVSYDYKLLFMSQVYKTVWFYAFVVQRR